MLDRLCEEFGCTPDEAFDLDEDRAFAVLRARQARRAAFVFDVQGTDKMTDGQTAAYTRMLNALDARDQRRGIPEEL
jgi:hypothetical protein